MNYLAHLFLAEHTPESLLGNLLGDFLQGISKERYSIAIQQGIQLHRKVDAYTDSHPIVKEAKQLVSKVTEKYRKNVAIKIPMTSEGLKAVKKLKKEKIKTNVTLIFSANQALLAAKAGATYVSPFIGRLDDIGQEGMQIIEEIMEIFYNYDIETEVIVASVRHPIHVIEAARLGADIATIPPGIIRKMSKHSLTDIGRCSTAI